MGGSVLRARDLKSHVSIYNKPQTDRCLVIHAHFTEEETEAENGDVQGHAASQGTEPGVSEPALSKHLVLGEEGAGLVS